MRSSSSSAIAMIRPPRARTSSTLLSAFSYWLPRGRTKTTGIPSSISAIGPCFISAAGIPSAWM